MTEHLKSASLDFVHVYEPPASPEARMLLLLHGTGGNEHDLVSLARGLDPAAGILSPRGKVLERGMPRFFRRFAEGVFDLEDLKVRTGELAQFVGRAAEHYGFDAHRITGIGFSNGANMAASLLLLAPGTLSGAVLFRAMVPIVPDPLPQFEARVLVSNGSQDPLVTPAQTEQLVTMLRTAGADVTLKWQPGGHGMTQGDVSDAMQFMRS